MVTSIRFAILNGAPLTGSHRPHLSPEETELLFHLTGCTVTSDSGVQTNCDMRNGVVSLRVPPSLFLL